MRTAGSPEKPKFYQLGPIGTTDFGLRQSAIPAGVGNAPRDADVVYYFLQIPKSHA